MPRARTYGPHLTAAALDLRKYIDAQHMSVPTFCEVHGLDRIQVQRMLNGQRERVSTAFAQAIQIATNGAVVWSRWNVRVAPPPRADESGSHAAVTVERAG